MENYVEMNRSFARERFELPERIDLTPQEKERLGKILVAAETLSASLQAYNSMEGLDDDRMREMAKALWGPFVALDRVWVKTGEHEHMASDYQMRVDTLLRDAAVILARYGFLKG